MAFCCVGAVIYAYTGNQYYTAPAFGSLGNEVYKKVSTTLVEALNVDEDQITPQYLEHPLIAPTG